MHSQQSMVSNLLDLLPLISMSHLQKKDQLNNLSQSFNSALSTTVSKIGELKTNLIYSIKHSDVSTRKEIELKKEGPDAQLLGVSYSFDEAYKFLFVFRTTFWLTYRKGIKDIETDNGWGCMIRAVQMLFAQVLKRHLKMTNTVKDQYQVIRHFSQQSDGVLSLSAVCEEGQINKRWTSALQIFTHFKNIMKRYPQNFTFYFQVYSSGVTYQNEEEVLLPSYPALVGLSNRVSIDSIPEQLHYHYFQLMKHKCWVGTIGGLNGEALYILGSYQNKVIFLDPHKVQSNEQEMEVQTYFCKTPRGIELSALSPSLSFCYYFQTKQQHLEWIRWISKTCEECHPNLVFEYISQQAKKKLQNIKQQQSQILSEVNIPEEAQQPPQAQQQQNLDEMELQIISGDNSGDFQILQ